MGKPSSWAIQHCYRGANQLLTQMLILSLHILLTFIVLARAAVTWTATPLNPPAVPLAVRSPYLSAWLQQGSGQALNDVWPSFWTGMVSLIQNVAAFTHHLRLQTLGWAGLIRVDGVAYTFLGAPGGLQDGVLKATQKNFTVCLISVIQFAAETMILCSSTLRPKAPSYSPLDQLTLPRTSSVL